MSVQLDGVLDPGQEAPMMGGQGLPVSPPEGHLVTIVASERKPATTGAGDRLVLKLKIQDGPAQGVEGDWGLNIWNTNPTAALIAQNELKCICHAIGHLQALSNTEPLHNKPFRVIVKQQVKNPQYTEVTDILRADGSKLQDKPNAQGGAPGPAPAPAPAPTMPPQQQPGAFPPPQQQAAPPVQTAPPPQQQPSQQPQSFPVDTNVAPPMQQQAAPQMQPPAEQYPGQQAIVPQQQMPPQQAPQQPAQNPPWGAPPQ